MVVVVREIAAASSCSGDASAAASETAAAASACSRSRVTVTTLSPGRFEEVAQGALSSGDAFRPSPPFHRGDAVARGIVHLLDVQKGEEETGRTGQDGTGRDETSEGVTYNVLWCRGRYSA